MGNSPAELEVLLPVHNEEATIEGTIREIFSELGSRVGVRIIVCEDGSRDNTKEVLRRLAEEFPLKLILSDEKKGYTRAVTDGMRALEAPFLLCIDADGQCDPKDFWKFWERRNDFDMVVGWRNPRQDPLLRRLMSGGFQVLYNLLYRVPLHDPSCPYILISRKVSTTWPTPFSTCLMGVGGNSTPAPGCADFPFMNNRSITESENPGIPACSR